MTTQRLRLHITTLTTTLLLGCAGAQATRSQPQVAGQHTDTRPSNSIAASHRTATLTDHSVTAELAFLCATFHDPALEALSPDRAGVEAANRLGDNLQHPYVAHMVLVAAASDRSVRYAILRAGAERLGHPEWECPIIERYWGYSVDWPRGSRRGI